MNSSLKPTLKIDWSSHDAALYSIKRWHYSKSMPCAKTARLGVWENGQFIGAIIFAWGANFRLAGEHGLKMTQVAELSSVALDKHVTPISRIVSISIKMLKRLCPGLRLLVSFADPQHGHTGRGVYAAMGWTYVGQRAGTSVILLNGRLRHRRTISSRFGTSNVEWLRANIDSYAVAVKTELKHKYLLGLDAKMRQKILPLSKPYPKTRATSETVDTSALHAEKRGSTPTVALQNSGCNP